MDETEKTDKTKYDQEIKSKLHGIKLASRVERKLCVHCGERAMQPNSGLCSTCRQLPRYKELLAPERNFEMEPVQHDGDIMITKPEAKLEPDRDTHSWVWEWDLIEWVFRCRIIDVDIPAATGGYQKMDDGKGGYFWRKQS